VGITAPAYALPVRAAKKIISRRHFWFLPSLCSGRDGLVLVGIKLAGTVAGKLIKL
jgi:hypothetical protein